ncbi:MAG: DUF4388 domain-containing protein [Anaeromyxobacter sp.]
MALRGTLRDFGIAEILQLIGQQAKSGILHLASREDEIHITIADGNLVGAESARRQARDRLGNMLVRAEIITNEELEHALDLQKRSLRRLGDVLMELGYISMEELKETTALQTTETVYRLFAWKSGDYSFDAQDVDWDPYTVTPLRAESVLMEGFRQVDEWPLIKKRISSRAMTFERLKHLDPGEKTSSRPIPKDDVDAAFDGLGEAPAEKKGEFATLGGNERKVYELALPGRTVEKVVDLSRLGEFETCKALLNLVNLGYLKAIGPAGRSGHVDAAQVSALATRVLATIALACALAGLVYWFDQRALAAQGETALADNAGQRYLSRYQVARLRSALDVFRLERGGYPAGLNELVEAGIVDEADLRHPWSTPYFYRRTPQGSYVLLAPVE